MNILFYIVFLAQILTISAIVPHMLRRRLRRILEVLPASSRPQLYSRPLARYRTGLIVFTWLNHLMVLAGLFLLVIVYRLHGSQGDIPETWPAFFGGVQFLPMLVMDLFCVKLLRRLRELQPVTQRSASLAPRRTFDFIPRWLLALAVAMVAISVLADLYLHGFALDRQVLIRNLTVLVTNALLALLGWWKLRGRSRMPHRDPQARNRSIGTQLTVLAVISIAFSIYALLHSANKVLGLANLDAIVMSLYFQTAMAVSVILTLRATMPSCRT
jgi:hypothetical protein